MIDKEDSGKSMPICDLCGERQSKIRRSDREGHAVHLCYLCNNGCNTAKMKVRDIIVLVVDRREKK